MWYAILQTKSTKSRGESRGRARGTVWSTELKPDVAKKFKTTIEVWLEQLLASDEGQAEVLAKFPSYEKLHAAMLHWHNVCQKTAIVGGTGRQRNDMILAFARKTFKKFNR
jgi:hypothetical protein